MCTKTLTESQKSVRIRKIAVIFGVCFAIQSAKANDVVSGGDFVVSHLTEIDAIGVNDGGQALTSGETVGIFDALTGNLVGPEVVFGPGISGNQVGDIFYESTTHFLLGPGDYSLIELSSLPQSGVALSGGNSVGGPFNAGAGVEISLTETSGGPGRSFDLVDPPVPDGGLTAMLLGGALAGIGWMRRRM